MENEQPFETRHHDLVGKAALDLRNRDDFNSFAAKFAGYDPNRFEPVALRVYVQDLTPIVTIYALDKSKQEDKSFPKDKLPVKKFKLEVDLKEFLRHIRMFDFTVSNEAYNIEDMQVINK